MKPKSLQFILCFCSLLPLLFFGKKQLVGITMFQQVEAFMPEYPDIALFLLKQVKDIQSLSKKNQAYYYLLLTEAEDKTYMPHTTDSLIRIAVNYYDKQDNLILKTKSWYYMGRVNQELKNALKAQEYYLTALKTGKNITDYTLLGHIYNNVGMLYTHQEVYEKAIPFQQKAITAFGMICDSSSQAYALHDLARNYTMLEKQDSAIACYEQAIQYIKKEKIPSYTYHQAEEQLSLSPLYITNLKVKYLSSLILASVLLLLVICVGLQLKKRKKFIQEQQSKLEQLKNKQAENEESIVKNNALIQALEIENKNLQSQRISTIEQFKISKVYLRFHNKKEWKAKPEDWEELFHAIDSTYTEFSHRLNEQLSKSTMQELQVCYLIKGDVPPSLMAQLLNCSATNISMIRKRLYQKICNMEGSSNEFDQFIRNL